MNNLAWLLASLTLAIAPHLGHLPLWVGPLCLALGGWRLAIARGKAKPPNKWFLFGLTAAITAGILGHFHTLLGRDAGVALLVAMIALKLMEMKAPRDTMVLIFLSYFLVITGFLYSQSIPMALYLFVVVLVTTTTMIGYQDVNGGLGVRPRLRLAGSLLVQAVPLMLVLFVLFPRVPPLWGLPKDAHAGMTGLSDSMSPGTISQLIGSEAIAFRVRFDGPPPPPNTRYWRGPVLWDYDGRSWSTRTPLGGAAAQVEPLGEALHYTLTLEPHDQRWLFALDLPVTLPPGSRAGGDMQILAQSPVQHRLRYSLVSHTDYRFGVELAESERQRALRLPADTNPRTLEFAGRWRATHENPRAIVDAALGLFRNQDFTYTLSPPLLGQQAVDDFLFGTRRGFCEHYAGAFVFLMRAAGIPARVVTGYQGGEMNPLGDYLIVRQSDAHAWAEVWLAGQGWVRIDPTAAVSPDRVESGIAAALPDAELPLAVAQLDIAWLQRMRMSWDLVDNNWNQWVLGYGQERQRSFLSRFHASLASWQGMIVTLAAGVAALLGAIALWMLWHAPRRGSDPVEAAYRTFCARLARRRITRSPHEGPADFALRAAHTRPDLAAQIDRITQLYIRLRYGRPPVAAGELRQAVRRFRP
jgi:transglutaminase-like putative cysteine protease